MGYFFPCRRLVALLIVWLCILSQSLCIIIFQHCDEVITREYPEMKGKSQVIVEMTGEEVKISSNDPTVIFDKSPTKV